MPKTKKGKAASAKTAESAAPTCAICMHVPPAGQGQHHCGTCAPAAWVVCASCEEALKGTKCPICRSDYMREATSGWDALPASTTELELDEQPTQDELKRISTRFPLLQQLSISVDYEDEPDELDFAADGIVFPVLTSLSLTCVGLKSITFTEANTPALVELELSNIMGQCCPFHLALPQLRSLDAEHTMLGERHIDTGQFGLSISRCPRLETLRSYKFRCLGDCNYAVLPSLRLLALHRSECTHHLDILYAPQLREVSLQAAFELRDFRLRNLPTATLATVEALLARKRTAEEAAREEARAEDRRWRDQANAKALTKEARRRGWIDKGEKWEVSAEPPGGMGMDGGDEEDEMGFDEDKFNPYDEVLQEHVSEMFDKRVDGAAKAAERELIGASVADESLPRVTIDATNMDGFRIGRLEPQVRSRCKLVKSRFGGGLDDDGFSLSDDDDDDGEEGEEEGEEEGGEEGEDPREHFMRMMMGTGMPQAAGVQMIPGRMGAARGPDGLGGGPIPLSPGEVQDPRRFLERMMMSMRAAGPEAEYNEDEVEPGAEPARSKKSKSTRPKRGQSSADAGRPEADYAY